MTLPSRVRRLAPALLFGLFACGGGSGAADAGPDAALVDGAAPPSDAAMTDSVMTDSGVTDSGVVDGAPAPDGGVAMAPSLAGCPMFPADNPWNTDISGADVHPRSDAFIASMGAGTGLHPDFGAPSMGAPNGIPYVVVGAGQPRVPMSFLYADESDPGPYPVPADAPIEGGSAGDGDRHVLVLETGSCTLYELFDAYPDAGGWMAGSGAIWHLDMNEVRPEGWTSADAAGLAILPGLVRYDEAVEAGEILHALRVTVSGAQRAFIRPASHSDGRGGTDPNAPPMGLRLRLHADFDVSSFAPEVQVMLRAMKRFGLMVADTGSDGYVTGVPDDRWNDDALHALGNVHMSDFDAVYTGDPIAY